MNTQELNITVNSPIIDKIAYLLPWDKDTSSFTINPIEKALQNLEFEINSKTCETGYTQKSRYKKRFKILLSNDEHAFVQFGAVDPIKQKGGIRIEFNPAKLEPVDIEKIHHVMGRIFDEDTYKTLMKTPLLQVLHIAVDIENLKLDDVLIEYKNSHRTTMFAKRYDNKGHIEGYNFGSVSSDYQTAVYDKKQERIHTALLKLVRKGKAGYKGDELKNNKVTQYIDKKTAKARTRLEIRGKKLHGLNPYQLKEQPNRFGRFRFIDLSNSNAQNLIPDYIFQSFLALCRQYNIKHALNNFRNTEYARKLHKFSRTNDVIWWDSEDLWEESIRKLKSLNIFPKTVWRKIKE